MSPQLSYQASMARIDDLHREAAKNRLGALAIDGRRRARPVPHMPRFRFGMPARGRVA